MGGGASGAGRQAGTNRAALRAHARSACPRLTGPYSRSTRVPGNKVGSRDRRANMFRRALRLLAARWLIATSIIGDALSQLDCVALHLVIERGALDAEEFRCFFLVTVAFCKRLNNRGSFHVVETLYARTREPADLCLLQSGRQLYFRWQLFHADHALSRQYHRVFDRVLQFANVPRPRVIQQFLKRFWRNIWFGFAELLSKLPHERSDQRWDILFPFSKRRHLNLKCV